MFLARCEPPALLEKQPKQELVDLLRRHFAFGPTLTVLEVPEVKDFILDLAAPRGLNYVSETKFVLLTGEQLCDFLARHRSRSNTELQFIEWDDPLLLPYV